MENQLPASKAELPGLHDDHKPMPDRHEIEPVTSDAWHSLRRVTAARVALGRAGGSLPTREWLNFKADHAAARDAVHDVFDAKRLADELRSLESEVLIVDTAASDRRSYLERPDCGRQLAEHSRAELEQRRPPAPVDLALIVSDGLSAIAAQRHAQPLIMCLLPRLKDRGWTLAPIVVARFGRVALQDQIGDLLHARISLILLGERPGLASPDSLGAYLVFAPRAGNTDANRNCVSNIRPEGLPYEAAAETLLYLLSESRRRRFSGVALKDERLSSPKLSAT